MQKGFPIHRTRIGKDLIAEFVVPPTEALRKKGRVVIIGKGAPAMPSANALLEFLAHEGFYAVLPRYRGTWESSGLFLKDDPTKDLAEVLTAIKEPLVSLFEKKAYDFPKNPKVYLMVASFGGPAGFFLSSDARVEAVFAYAPVVNWLEKTTEPIEEFNETTKLMFGVGYRIFPSGWKKLKSGTFYNPAAAKDRINGKKVHIFHAKDDIIVACKPVEQFAQEIGAECTVYPDGGHGGVSAFMEPRTWKKIKSTIEKLEK